MQAFMLWMEELLSRPLFPLLIQVSVVMNQGQLRDHPYMVSIVERSTKIGISSRLYLPESTVGYRLYQSKMGFMETDLVRSQIGG